MLDLFKSAVEQRTCLEVDYEPGKRIIEVHAVGYSSDGNILVRAFQQSGASASGEHKHWKLFRLDRMKAANDNDAAFSGPRDGYKKGDKAMKGGIIREL